MFKILKELFCPSKEISITKKSLQKKKKKIMTVGKIPAVVSE